MDCRYGELTHRVSFYPPLTEDLMLPGNLTFLPIGFFLVQRRTRSLILLFACSTETSI